MNQIKRNALTWEKKFFHALSSDVFGEPEEMLPSAPNTDRPTIFHSQKKETNAGGHQKKKAAQEENTKLLLKVI